MSCLISCIWGFGNTSSIFFQINLIKLILSDNEYNNICIITVLRIIYTRTHNIYFVCFNRIIYFQIIVLYIQLFVCTIFWINHIFYWLFSTNSNIFLIFDLWLSCIMLKKKNEIFLLSIHIHDIYYNYDNIFTDIQIYTNKVKLLYKHLFLLYVRKYIFVAYRICFKGFSCYLTQSEIIFFVLLTWNILLYMYFFVKF